MPVAQLAMMAGVHLPDPPITHVHVESSVPDFAVHAVVCATVQPDDFGTHPVVSLHVFFVRSHVAHLVVVHGDLQVGDVVHPQAHDVGHVGVGGVQS